MQKGVFLLLILSLLLCLAHASTSLGLRTLVLTEGSNVQFSHSEFFQILKDLGHTLRFSDVQENVVSLKTVDKYNFDNVFVFASKSEELGGGNIKASDLIDFVDNGGSLFMGAGEDGLSETLRSVANTYGVDFDEDSSYVADASAQLNSTHPLYTSSSSHPLLSLDVEKVDGIVDNGKIIFTGIGQLLIKSRFARNVVSGSASSVSQNPAAAEALVSGKDCALISAVQTLGNGRILLTGSLNAFSNEFLAAQNRAVLSPAVQWAVHARGFIRLTESAHFDTISGLPKPMYKLHDPVTVTAVLEQYDGAKWVPYVSDSVTFEAIMLDPYIRQRLPCVDPTTGRYRIDVTAPDTHGVYKFRISANDFSSGGAAVAFVQHDMMVPIRPYRHNEYERFMFVATPYYAGTLGLLGAFFVFSALFLYSK